MKYKSISAMGAIAVAIGLAGFAATGCQNLDVGTAISPGDTVGRPGLDDPGTGGTGTGGTGDTNVIPRGTGSGELEPGGR